jgi:hypothetical protein
VAEGLVRLRYANRWLIGALIGALMTSVQAGFEPWTGGTGLRTSSFSVTRNGA